MLDFVIMLYSYFQEIIQSGVPSIAAEILKYSYRTIEITVFGH